MKGRKRQKDEDGENEKKKKGRDEDGERIQKESLIAQVGKLVSSFSPLFFPSFLSIEE